MNRNYWCCRFRKKLLKFLQGISVNRRLVHGTKHRTAQLSFTSLKWRASWSSEAMIHDLLITGSQSYARFICTVCTRRIRWSCCYTTNTLDTLWRIYCWDICTTCRYRIYVLLYWRMCSGKVLSTKCSMQLPLTLYCVVPYIAPCVDVSELYFRDRSRTQ